MSEEFLNEVWDLFVRKTFPPKGDLKPYKPPVNFIGSVAHHKKMFFEAIDDISRERGS